MTFPKSVSPLLRHLSSWQVGQISTLTHLVSTLRPFPPAILTVAFKSDGNWTSSTCSFTDLRSRYGFGFYWLFFRLTLPCVTTIYVFIRDTVFPVIIYMVTPTSDFVHISSKSRLLSSYFILSFPVFVDSAQVEPITSPSLFILFSYSISHFTLRMM